MTKTKKCEQCGETKPRDAFWKVPAWMVKRFACDSHAKVCKSCKPPRKTGRPTGGSADPESLPDIPEGAANLTTGASLGHQAYMEGEDVVVSQLNDGKLSTIYISRGDLARLAVWVGAQPA